MTIPKTLVAGLAVVLSTALACGTDTGADASASLSSSSATLAETTTQAPAERAARKPRQRGQLVMHPQIAGSGTGVQAASAAKSAMTATFKPRKKGRPVVLQRKTGRGWSNVVKSRQSRRGVVEFTAPYAVSGKTQTYRALALKVKGLPKTATPAASTGRHGAADFTDDFSGAALNPSVWADRMQNYQPGRKCAKSDLQAVSVGDGVARLGAIDDPARPSLTDQLQSTQKCNYKGKSYAWRLNGHIGTQGRQSFKYGYAAARIKFQPRRGQHAAFWMQPESRAAAEGSATRTGAEIDIIEYFGDNHPNGGLASFIYHYPNNNKASVTAKKVGGFIQDPKRFGNKWASRYHVFSVEWTPQRYVFRIDGQETFRTSQGVSGREQYLILSMLSSDYELGFLGGDDKLPQRMSVDWVRFWER